MSGIITGTYFKKYFDEPTAIQLGTMVAVLEIGAFGKDKIGTTPPYFLIFRSNLHSRRARG
jgi:hypothetical protein